MSKNRERKIELLRRVPLFGLCEEKELKDIAALTDEITIKAGTPLTTEGQPGRECYIVISGKGEATLRGELLGTIGEGEVIGEMALLDPAPRSATVKAVTDMECFVLDPRSFSDMLDRHPGVSKRMLQAMARRLRALENAPTYQH